MSLLLLLRTKTSPVKPPGMGGGAWVPGLVPIHSPVLPAKPKKRAGNKQAEEARTSRSIDQAAVDALKSAIKPSVQDDAVVVQGLEAARLMLEAQQLEAIRLAALEEQELIAFVMKIAAQRRRDRFRRLIA